MNVFDCHFHIEEGMSQYNIDTAGRNIIFNSFDSYDRHHNEATSADSLTLIFDYRDNFGRVKELMSAGKINGLKIHNRVQKISAADQPVLLDRLQELNPTVPIVIDAFYFGDDLEYQPSLSQIIAIAKKFPDVPVIVAHCGGIEILKYFYHLKPLENICFDLSFSLAYLRNTSVFADYKNLIKYGNPNRILFGTDYPFVNAGQQLDTFLQIADEMNVTDAQKEKMLFSNATGLFKRQY